MSSAHVRTTMRTAISPLLAGAFTYIESINTAEATSVLPDRWFTLSFVASDDSRIALGQPALFRESGSTVVLIFTEHQVGDQEAADAAEVIRSAMCNYELGHLRVLDVGPPREMDGGDFRGSYYGLTVDVRYQYDRLE